MAESSEELNEIWQSSLVDNEFDELSLIFRSGNSNSTDFCDKLENHYDLTKPIGRGSSSLVFEAVVVNDKKKFAQKGQLVAIKFVRKDKSNLAVSNTDFRDIETLSICSTDEHPNIVQLYEGWESRNFVIVVEELINGCSLSRCFKGLSPDQTKFVIKSILHGLAFLHGKQIAHRDLKLDNILLSFDKDKISRVVIIDFGLSKLFTSTDSGCSEKMNHNCGAPFSRPPEMILSGCYDEKVDIWALGVVSFILVFKYHPFLSQFRSSEILWKNFTPCLDAACFEESEISPIALQFLKRLFEEEPDARCSALEALDDPWLKDS